MVPATFTKHLVTIAHNQTKRKRLEEQQHAMQGTESLHARQGEKLQTISHGNGTLLWEVHNCNFNLFLLKNWPCRLLNLIHCHKPWSFIGTWQWPNPCPGMCIYFSSKSEWNSYIVCALLCMTGQTQPTSCTHFFKYYGREKFEYNSAVSQHVMTAVPPFGSTEQMISFLPPPYLEKKRCVSNPNNPTVQSHLHIDRRHIVW